MEKVISVLSSISEDFNTMKSMRVHAGAEITVVIDGEVQGKFDTTMDMISRKNPLILCGNFEEPDGTKTFYADKENLYLKTESGWKVDNEDVLSVLIKESFKSKSRLLEHAENVLEYFTLSEYGEVQLLSLNLSKEQEVVAARKLIGSFVSDSYPIEDIKMFSLCIRLEHSKFVSMEYEYELIQTMHGIPVNVKTKNSMRDPNKFNEIDIPAHIIVQSITA